MDKKEKDCGYRRPLRKYLIAALAGGLLGALIVGFYFMPPKDSGQLAAWVQAIGSVGAIIIAVVVMRHQSNMQIEAHRREQEIFLSTMKTIFEGIKLRLEAAKNDQIHPLDSKRWNAFQIDLSCLEVTNMEMFRSSDLLRAFIESRGSLNLLVKDAARHHGATGFSEIMRKNVQDTLEAVDGFLEITHCNPSLR
ncbi:hypothetical protein ACBP93_08370 [Paenalcaligenes hominis]|uniref:Uncharacterized protein n=1 Tax=Paenalcaligenes hominis TaxID=643674 RepID=A0A1U9JY76_9BURK|nr:hypothetical protein [Paenalcaligenes hominis]AQS50763.1 hypothetical protein PAEH1_02860 [Paenalcaligenes hominis]